MLRISIIIDVISNELVKDALVVFVKAVFISFQFSSPSGYFFVV